MLPIPSDDVLIVTYQFHSMAKPTHVRGSSLTLDYVRVWILWSPSLSSQRLLTWHTSVAS